jgi:hypothetical protein
LFRLIQNALRLQPKTAFLVFLLFPQIASAAAVSIMPLGDSITRGSFSGVIPDDPPYYISYRKALKNRLVSAGYTVDFIGSQVAGDAVLIDAQHEGHGGWFADDAGSPSTSILPNVIDFLSANPAEIVLLHIGTNDIDAGENPASVASEIDAILDAIDTYEQISGRDVWVVLALIINRATGCSLRVETKNLNDLLDQSVSVRSATDKLVVVDMEIAIDSYEFEPNGEMYDCLHPYATGYAKMAEAWFQGLLGILPTANAGFDQDVNPGDTVILDGGGSTDALGTITIYSWSQTAGPPVALANANTAQASFKAPDLNGGDRLTFRLTIADDKQHTHSDECDVRVNSTPMADAGGDQQVSDGQAVILDGTGSSDPDGAIAAYQWRQVNGSPAVALAADSTAVAHFVAPALGSAGALLTFQLTVTDDRGVQNSDTVVVGVNRPPVPDGGSSGSGGGGGGCFITAAGG